MELSHEAEAPAVEAEEKRKLPTLFDFIKDISTDKQYIFTPDDISKHYSAFMVNRGLAQHVDTILLANEMNKRPHLSKLMHHDYLFYAVGAKKRYGKWAKADKTDEDLIDFIKERYAVNQSVAIEYLDMLDKTEVKKLKKESERKGGR